MSEKIKQNKIKPSVKTKNDAKLNEDQVGDSFNKTTINRDCLEDNLKMVKNIQNVAENLGVEDTRKYLIPQLTNLIIANELSELKELAIILGDFECYVGGPKYAHILMLPLEELAGAKLSDVRMAAIKSLQALADIMEVLDLETYFIPLIASMTMNDRCAKRWSVCHLFTTVYVRVSPKHQNDLIDYHCFLSFDSLPSVRQDAANILVDLSEVVHLSTFDSKLIPRLEQFSFDQNEHVRTLALSAAISMIQIFDISYIKQTILPIILNSINDPSWGVRLILIKNFTMLIIVGTNCLKIIENIIQVLILLTKDRQLEVRLQSINILYDCSVILYENLTYTEANKLVVEFLIPALCNLCHDSDFKCKLKVLPVLAKFRKIISNEIIKDYFVDSVKELLNDKNVDVVFNVVKYMKEILGPQYINMIKIPEDRLICCLKAFIINDSWKVRNMGAIYLGILSIQMGLQFFEEFLEQSFIILLTDAKSTVQQTAMDVFKLLVTEFGMDWAQTYIVPYLVTLSYSRNTYNKMAFLSFAKNISKFCDQSMLKMLFPHVIYHHSDENPNIRYALLNTLNVMITSILDQDDVLVEKIKTTIKTLISDTSNYIGELAIHVWDEHFNSQIPSDIM